MIMQWKRNLQRVRSPQTLGNNLLNLTDRFRGCQAVSEVQFFFGKGVAIVKALKDVDRGRNRRLFREFIYSFNKDSSSGGKLFHDITVIVGNNIGAKC